MKMVVMVLRLLIWTGIGMRVEKMIVTYKIMVGMPQEKKPNGLSRCRYEDNVKVDPNRHKVRGWTLYETVRGQWRTEEGFGGFKQPPPPKFRSLAKFRDPWKINS
jgi:hypothetical protein